MRSFWFGFWLFMTTMVALAFVMRPDTVDGVLLYAGWMGAGVVFAVLGLVYLVPVCGLIAFFTWLWFYIKAQRTDLLRPKNGSYAMQKIDPRKPVAFWIPDNAVTAGTTYLPEQGFIEHSGGVPWDVQHSTALARAHVANTQAAQPSDEAIVKAAKHISSGMGGAGLMRAMRPGAAEQRALDAKPKGWFDDLPVSGPQQTKMPVPVAPPAIVPTYTPTLRDAVEQAQPFVWPIGFNAETQKLAAFRFDKHFHAGVVGSSGTGKTTGVGFLMVCHALRQGVHTVVIDGDGGASWNALAPWTEHIPADDKNLPDILTALEDQMEARGRALVACNAQTWQETNGLVRPMLVVLEEYGDLRSRIGAANKKDGEAIDDKMDRLLRRARKVGIGMVIVDQYPELWSQQMVAACKCLCAFQLGPNQGNKVGEYEAQNLPDTGVFLLRGVRYNTWPTHSKVAKLLADVPALSVSSRIIDRSAGVRSEGRSEPRSEPVTSGTPTPPPQEQAPNAAPVKPSATELQAAVWAWRDAYPTATQAQLRAAFAAANMDIARSWAHDCFHSWGRERLAQFERDELSEAQVQALFEAGLLDVRSGPMPGAQQVSRD